MRKILRLTSLRLLLEPRRFYSASMIEDISFFTLLNSIACVLLSGLTLYLLAEVSRLERDLDYTRFVALRRPAVTINIAPATPSIPIAEIQDDRCSECREGCPSDCQCWCHGIKSI